MPPQKGPEETNWHVKGFLLKENGVGLRDTW